MSDFKTFEECCYHVALSHGYPLWGNVLHDFLDGNIDRLTLESIEKEAANLYADQYEDRVAKLEAKVKKLEAHLPIDPVERFKKFMDDFRHGLHRASLDYYLETGNVSGSLLISVNKMFESK